MFASYLLKVIRGAVALLMPLSASLAVGQLTGTTTPLVAPRARAACAPSVAAAPQSGFVSAGVPVETAVSNSVALPVSRLVTRSETLSGATTVPAPQLLPSPRAQIGILDDSTQAHARGLDRAMGQVLDIVQRYGGNVLSAGRGDRMRSDEAGSRASFASTPSSGKALADMVIEVPSERLNCAIGELTSHALGKLAHYEVCRPYVSNGVVNLTGRLLNRRAPQVIRFRLVPKDAPAGDTIVGAQGLTKVQRDIDEIATPQQKETGESPLVLSAPCGGKPGRR